MVPTFLPFWPQHIAFFHTHMHHWLQSTVQWVCLSKHPPGYGWKWMTTKLSNSQPDARERKTSAKSQQSKVECEKLCSNLNINNVLAWISKSVKPELLPGVNHKWIKQAPEKQAAMTVSILTCQCHPASLCFLFGIRLEKKLHLRLGRCSVHTDEGCHL